MLLKIVLYRPNDRQAIPGFIKVMEQGQTKFQIGNNENFVDWTYVENCAYAHILAVDKLSVENQTAGEVNIKYFAFVYKYLLIKFSYWFFRVFEGILYNEWYTSSILGLM